MGDELFQAFLRHDRAAVCRVPDGSWIDGPPPTALLPGSFNPLHEGHVQLATVAARVLGQAVAFELSLANVDKPELNPDEALRRLEAFRGVAPVWLTRAATFERKARCFPGCAFVVGFDTAERLVDAKYSGGNGAIRDALLERLRAGGHRFVVGGRRVGDAFRTWDDRVEPWRDMFVALGEEAFRVDRSSTELRNR